MTSRAGNSSRDRSEIQQYLIAAQRKIEIARYHFEELCKQLDQQGTVTPTDAPPIPVQARFEGVVVSIIAAEEKVKEAIRRRYGVARKNSKKCESRYSKLGQQLPALRNWYEKPLLNDIQEVRNLAIHHHYEKMPSGLVGVWKIDRPESSNYDGPRELRKYCQAAKSLGCELSSIIPQIEELLRQG
ncbi:MAG: hypothetical protein P8Z30_18710 [Acidobacteriota bacterium]